MDIHTRLTRNRSTVPLVLVIAAVFVYSTTTGFGFLATWDDQYYVVENTAIRGFSPQHLMDCFSGYFVGNYAPLHILSYMLDHLFWGLDPAGYHLTNVVLHAMNGLLFYLLMRRLEIPASGATIAAWLFLFHPVQVETVAWISQRKNLLAMFFFLGALMAYSEYRRRETERLVPYLLSGLCLLASGLSKSVAVIFPVVALLYDYTYARQSGKNFKERLWDKVPFVVIAAAIAVMAVLSQAEEAGGGRREYPGGSPLSALFTMVPVLAGYIRDCIFPFRLSPYYMVPIRDTADGVFLLSTGVLVAVAVSGIFLYRRMRPMLFWLGLFFIALLPVMQIVPLITLKNDRYLYFPMLGFAVLAATAVTLLHQRLTSTSNRLILSSVTVIILLALPVLSFQQALYWRDDVTLWSRAVDLDPENRLAWPLLAKGYTARGDSTNAFNAINRYMELRDKYGPLQGYKDL